MKETKKQRKLRKGMNAATRSAYEEGYRPPKFMNVNPPNMPANFVKVDKGVPYVNPSNFGM